jgi:iron complex transport system substrate-binding protein
VRRSPLLAGLALGALALGLTACGERAEPTGELAQTYPVTVRGAGDASTVVESRPLRIVALDPGSAELLRALGVGKRLVGAPEGTPGATSVVKSTGQVLVDRVVRLKPDLIVATGATDRVNVSQAVRRTRADLYVQPAESIADVERATLELGFAVGEPVAARKLRASIHRDAAAVDARLAGTPRVTVFVDTGFFIPAPDETLLGSLVARAHGTNVAAGDAGLGPFDLAELARLDPDVYVALSDSGTTRQKLERTKALTRLSALRSGRFVILDTALVTSAGPRVAEAYTAVAKALHPDAFR